MAQKNSLSFFISAFKNILSGFFGWIFYRRKIYSFVNAFFGRKYPKLTTLEYRWAERFESKKGLRDFQGKLETNVYTGVPTIIIEPPIYFYAGSWIGISWLSNKIKNKCFRVVNILKLTWQYSSQFFFVWMLMYLPGPGANPKITGNIHPQFSLLIDITGLSTILVTQSLL